MIKRRNGIISIAIICFVLLSFVLSGIYLAERNCINNVKIKILSTDENISLFKNNDSYYAFLPAYVKVEEIKLLTDQSHRLFIDGTESSKTSINPGCQYTFTIKNLFGLTVCNEKLIIMQSANISTLSIQLTNGTIEELHKNKETEKKGNVKCITSEAAIQYNGSFKSIHGRGNSSWEKEKKPYVIEFEQPVNLVGFGKIKNYCLIASANEWSNLRNKIAYDLANAIGLQNSPRSEFVDLYIDDKYYGLYLLVEKPDVAVEQINLNPLEFQTEQINQFKLDTYPRFETSDSNIIRRGLAIVNNPADITGGYLLELEYYERLFNEKSIFSTKSGLAFSVQYPKACSTEQINYIGNLFQLIENSLLTENFSTFIDIQSWAKYYLIQEFLSNTDQASYYYYKNSDIIDPKVYAGPIWDFDLSIGLGGYAAGVNGITNPYRYYVNNWSWYAKLCEQPSFKSVVKEIYTTQLRPAVNNLLSSTLNNYYKQIKESWLMNQCRWKNIQLCNWVEFPETLQGHIAFIQNFLFNRIKCFDSNVINNEPLVKITLKSETVVEYDSYFYIAYNSCIDTLGTLSSDGYTFIGWYDKQGNPIDLSEQITQDKVYYAKWDNSPQTNSQSNEQILTDNIKSLPDIYISAASFGIICLIIAIAVFKDILTEIKKRKKHGE